MVVALAFGAVDVADPIAESVARLDPEVVLLEKFEKVKWFGGEAVGKNGPETSRVVEIELTTELSSVMSAAASFGRDKASATRFALPWTYLMSVVYSAIHDS